MYGNRKDFRLYQHDPRRMGSVPVPVKKQSSEIAPVIPEGGWQQETVTDTPVVGQGMGWFLNAKNAEQQEALAMQKAQMEKRLQDQKNAELLRLKTMQDEARRRKMGNSDWGDVDLSMQGLKNFGSNVLQTGGGLLSGIRDYANRLYNDPTRLGLLAGGLAGMDSENYRDKFGNYSVGRGLGNALGTGVNTFRTAKTPIMPSFEKQKQIELRNAQALQKTNPTRFTTDSFGRVIDRMTGRVIKGGGRNMAFAGTGMEAQDRNILTDKNADTSSAVYASAWYKAAEPRPYFNPQTQQWTFINPNMTAYPRPTGRYAPELQSGMPGGVSPITTMDVPGKTKDFKLMTDNIDRVETALDGYEELLTETGAEIWPGQKKLQLQTAHTNLLMEMKELLNLGVLNGPDLELMEKMIINPTSLEAQGYEFFGGIESLTSQLDLVRRKLNFARDRAKRIYGPKGARPPQQGTAGYPYEKKKPVDQTPKTGQADWIYKDGKLKRNTERRKK